LETASEEMVFLKKMSAILEHLLCSIDNVFQPIAGCVPVSPATDLKALGIFGTHGTHGTRAF
jgi:hypothetical protein